MSFTRDDVLISVRQVTKRYGSKEVLSGVDFDIRDLHCPEMGIVPGQVVAILGPSGVGKSQLIQAMSGLERPTIGGVYLDGDAYPVKAGSVGVVFQRYPLWKHRTVLGNLRLVGRIAGMHDDAATLRGCEYLEMFELGADADKYPAELSGGMQQRLAIARQLMKFDGPGAHPTRLLLMDEPFAALDPRNTRRVCGMIRKVADLNDKNTICIVTHDMRAALSIADMLVVLGRDRDATGAPTSGGKVKRIYDLAMSGFPCFADDIYIHPEFERMERELSGMFQEL